MFYFFSKIIFFNLLYYNNYKMSLVIATNKDQDDTFRQEESVYSAFSFKNDLSSTYKIPANSQVALQSCKVNLDGRITISANNSWWYDYFGEDLDGVETLDDNGNEVDVAPIDLTTSYPKLQDLDVPKDQYLELTTDELATRLTEKHREYHPNLFDKFTATAKRNSGLDFLGFEFKYDQNVSQTHSKFPDNRIYAHYSEEADLRLDYNASRHVIRKTGTYEDPAVAIFNGAPLSLSNGSMRVHFNNANASQVPFGIGLSRDIPDGGYLREDELLRPFYFDMLDNADESFAMGVDDADYFEDFGIHRNDAGELVLRHSVSANNGRDMVYKEVKYWLNADSDLTGSGRYDLNNNSGNYEWVEFKVKGEIVEAYIGHSGATDLICSFSSTSVKNTYFKPVMQTCWCLHPVFYIGSNGASQTNHLVFNHFSGIDITGYNPRSPLDRSKKGWFETAMMLSNIANFRPIARCRQVDLRLINDPTKTNDPYDYIPNGVLTGSNNAIDLKYRMILTPNDLYFPTFGSACADLFGFPGRSLVEEGTGTFPAITFASDSAPDLNCMKSIFIRLNGFGQQVLNARTGNKSTILSHLPTADSKSTQGTSQRVFYEPKNLIWLDLNNPYELVVSDFSIDFVYSNEQYARILQGQSVVCLYFREKGKPMME